MATLKKYNITGKAIGDVKVDDRFVEAEANGQMIKDYITAIRANARQWSANTKTRSEVNHTTKKPHPQKGQGRARQGMLSAPQYKGGGRVFGPKPKFDQHVRINKKERRAAIRYLISEKIRENKLLIIEETSLDAPRTKSITSFLKTVNVNHGRVLFLGETNRTTIEFDDVSFQVDVASTQHENFIKSLRNLPKVEFTLASNLSGYDVMLAQHMILTEAALNELTEWLC